MSWRALLCCAALLAGCVSTPPPPGTLVSPEKLAQTVVPGRTTKAELLGTFGPTKAIVFDSGYEAWLYQSPAAGATFNEFVILLDPAGVVKKTRQRVALP
jgi:hypothetical protein